MIMTEDTTDENALYLERLADALRRLGIIEMEGLVVDGSEVAGAIMALDAQITAGWQLAESVRLTKEVEARLLTIDRSTDSEAWVAASRDLRSADKAMTVALMDWDKTAGLDDEEADPPALAS
jgi:hypothetical protein